MTTKKLNKLTMALAVEDICDENATVLTSVPAFQDAYLDAHPVAAKPETILPPHT